MVSIGAISGSALLIHAAYSSYEWVTLNKQIHGLTNVPVTRDIKAEIVFGLILIILDSLFSGLSQLQPVRISNLYSAKTISGEDIYSYLETRPNFQDLNAKCNEYIAWRKETEGKL